MEYIFEILINLILDNFGCGQNRHELHKTEVNSRLCGKLGCLCYDLPTQEATWRGKYNFFFISRLMSMNQLKKSSFFKIKSDMEKELKFSKAQLGYFDTALLLPYALIQV